MGEEIKILDKQETIAPMQDAGENEIHWEGDEPEEVKVMAYEQKVQKNEEKFDR